MKTLQNHFVRSALFLLFALLYPVLGWGQGTPYLDPRDFTVNLIAGNKTCNTPGAVNVYYRNAVAGYKTLHYEFSKDGLDYDIEQDAAPNATITQSLAGWRKDDEIYIRVTGIMDDGSRGNAAILSKDEYTTSPFEYREQSIADATIVAVSKAAGGCNGANGNLALALNLSGIASVEWKVFQGGTLLKTINTSTPTIPSVIDHLVAGTYRVEARATPACPTTHPTLTTPGASWDGNVLVLTDEVTVDAFHLKNAYTSSTVGTCGGNFSCQVERIAGISSITADLLPKGGATVLKTMETNAQRQFYISFSDIPVGDYVVRATADCGAVVKKEFTMKAGAPSVTAFHDQSEIQQSICGKDIVKCYTNGNPQILQTFRLIHVPTNTVVATKTWKWTQEEQECRFTGLTLKHQEDYIVEADFCGATQQSRPFKVYNNFGSMNWNVISNVKGICTGEGGKVVVQVTNNGNPMTMAGTFELILNGQVVYSQSMSDGWSGEVTFNDLPYFTNGKAKFTLNCGKVIEYDVYLSTEGSQPQIEPRSVAWIDNCTIHYGVEFRLQGPSGKGLESLTDGFFKLYQKDGTLIWQGNYIPNYDNEGRMRIPVPGEGEYFMTATYSCGSGMLQTGFKVEKIDLFAGYENARPEIRFLPFPCQDLGLVDITALDLKGKYGVALDEFVWKLEKDGVPYRNGFFNFSKTSKITELKNLPAGKYKLTTYLQCDPTIKKDYTFELKSELMPFGFQTQGSCGSKILGVTSFSFHSFATSSYQPGDNSVTQNRLNPYSYRLYNADSGVLYQEGNLTYYSSGGYNHNLKFSQALPSGNYRMEIRTPSYLCGGIPPYNYNFTVPHQLDGTYVLSSAQGSKKIDVVNTPYLTSNGSITVGIHNKNNYQSSYSIANDYFPVIYTLQAKDGSLNKTLTATGIEKNVTFDHLPAGRYLINASIDGITCFPEAEVKVETTSDEVWSASAHRSPRCEQDPQRKPHVSFRITGTHPSLTSVIYTFKVYVWDDIASDYVLDKSFTGAPGQLTAVIDNVKEYAGTSAPLILKRPADLPSHYPWTAPIAAYQYVIETGGREVFSTLDVVQQNNIYYQARIQKVDATFTKPTGSVTAKIDDRMGFYDYATQQSVSYPAPFSSRDRVIWTCRRNDGGGEISKTLDPFTPVTFENLAPGNYSLQGQLSKRGCSGNFTWINSSGFEILAPGVHIQATGTDGKCDSDCKIAVKVLDDADAFSKVTYTITYMEDGNEKNKVLSTTDATQEKVFENLSAGNYKVKAEAEILTSDGLRTFTATSEVTLKTNSPDMNIIQHVEASRPSFNSCATGYLAFRFQDGYYTPPKITDDYEFTITQAPAGVVVPVSFKLAHFTTGFGQNSVAITPFRNLPPGEYKVKVVNSCKTLFLTCKIEGIEDLDLSNPFDRCIEFNQYQYYNYGYLGYTSALNLEIKNGKYWFNYSPLSTLANFFGMYGSNNEGKLWDDLITQDIHDSFGNEMTGVPVGYEAKEMTIRPWAIDKITLNFNCSGKSPKVFSGTLRPCGRVGSYCDQPTVNVADMVQRPAFPEIFTLVVNEMNGSSIGAEVLRKVNPNQTYSLGTDHKTFLVRIYTADNTVVYSYTMTPTEVNNTLKLEPYDRKQSCHPTTGMSVYIQNDKVSCYMPYVLKFYKGTGASRTFLSDQLITRYESSLYNNWDTYISGLSLNTDYEVELYTNDGRLLDTKTMHTRSAKPSFTLPGNFLYFGNSCDTRISNTTTQRIYLKNKDSFKQFYQLKYVYANNPLPTPPAGTAYPDTLLLTVVKDGVTYKMETYYGITTMDQGYGTGWFTERNGKRYYSDGPIYAWDETITGTLSAPGCGIPPVSVTGKAVKKENNFTTTRLENMKLVQTCTGWDVTPGGKISYIGVDGNRHTLTYKEYLDPYTGQWKDVTVPFAQPKSPNEFYITLRGDDLCDISVYSTPLIYHPLALNQVESASYYCADDNKGRIYIGAQDGVPPYRYELLDGENESDPIVETKHSSGSVVFEYGDVGKKYRVQAFDACGNLRIHYLTTVLSTVDLGYQLSKTLKLCGGDNLKLTMQSFPGATYDWTLPDGTHRNTRIIDLGPATRAMAGAYNVAITPTDCNSTINATITVEVNDVGAPSWTPAMQTICQGTTTTLSPGAAQSYTGNTPGTPKYQWQKRNPYETNFDDIAGATLADYDFPADNPGTYTFRRVTTYNGCKHTSNEAKVVVTPGPIQKLSPAELDRTVRKGSTGYTLTVGSLQTNGTTIASYKWERSTDGVVWTTVGTTANYKETEKLKLEKVYYRRTVTPTVGTCAHTTPTITVNFKKMRTAYVNPHIRTRVKSE